MRRAASQERRGRAGNEDGGRGEGGERKSGEGAIGARRTKVAARAIEQGRGEGGEW